ncbi:MAG: UbiA prenyltransferase family protein [Thermoanaerobaculaceae bacterium]|nr:UbiA prenyltransferase family protein [Thermoanaerobaculaceae bacterium]MDI9622390.1 UbiA prenyltransferase family protein [Acidobacteriota bacterium]NLH11145.1 UbiA prenyltransferase family protein [Holophagae bacterium]HPW54291.1 UbiA prenyltransferase family protein [Thermoanaerobaculaceae bacterium]
MTLVRTLVALVRAMRPRQWLKNGFVVAPAVFAGHAFDPPALLRVGAAAGLFCLASSAVYLVNDVMDREADRCDPVKRYRPIAAGELSVHVALVAAVLLASAAVALGTTLGRGVLTALGIYLGLNLTYSLGGKLVVVLEAMLLATGFVVRLAAGALAIDAEISHWLLICGFLLALLLAFGKRVPEVSHPTSRTPRYPAAFLTEAVTLLAGVTLVAYVLYTVAPDTQAKIHSRALLITAPVVLFGILRYLFLLTREGSQDPTAALLADRPLLVTVVVWTVLAGVIVAQAGGHP